MKNTPMTPLMAEVRRNFRSISELAMQMGWSYSKLYRIVSNRQIPTFPEAIQLSEFLGIKSLAEMKKMFGGVL